MKKHKKSKGDWKYLIPLVLIAILTVSSVVSGIKKNAEYDEYIIRREHAVTVVATVDSSYLQFREEVKWHTGAGDDVDKEVIRHPYRVHKLLYTYNGKEYSTVYGGAWSSSTLEMPKGTEIELMIDPNDPETVFYENYSSNKSNFFSTWLCLVLFFTVLAIWIFKVLKRRKTAQKR